MRFHTTHGTHACVGAREALVIVAFAVFGSTAGLSATTFTVTTTADSGAGSLRRAIVDANGMAGVDTIEFDIPAASCSSGGVCEIVLSSSLPSITEGLTIDGVTQPRVGSAPANVCAESRSPSYMRVAIVTDADSVFEVLDTADSTTIRGLAFTGSESTTAINVHSFATTMVQCNHFGVNAEGTMGVDLLHGVVVGGTHAGGSATIGTDGDGSDDRAERNVFGNLSTAVYINTGDESHPNWIGGNYFGIGADGTTPLDLSQGVYIRQSATGNLVGSNLDGLSDGLETNYFGWFEAGVFLNPQSGTGFVNHVAGNWFGVDPHGRPAPGGTAIIVFLSAQDQDIRSNQIHFNFQGIRVSGSGTIGATSGLNCITRNVTGLVHEGTEPALFAENNYWGAADGPSGVGTGSGDSIVEWSTGTVEFEPWLTHPAGVCAIVFVDGFESSDWSRWSSVTP